MVWVQGGNAPTYEDVALETGQRWNVWVRVLDQWDGNKSSLRPIVSYLEDEHNVPQRWAQVIALYYQVERL
jgi:hypothetical protein